MPVKKPPRKRQSPQDKQAKLVAKVAAEVAAQVAQQVADRVASTARAAADAAATVARGVANDVTSVASVDATVKALGPVLQDVVTVAVEQTLTKIGFRLDDPNGMRLDLMHLREWRETMQIVRSRGIQAIVTAFIVFITSAIGFGVLYLVKR